MFKKLLFLSAALLMGFMMNAQTPTVDYNVDEVGTDFITISFTPNADVTGYAYCLFEAGTAEQQFAMFGPWMGFQTMGDMVKAWGINQTEASQYTWNNQSPGYDYEIYVYSWDDAGNDDMVIIAVTTQSLGGDGLAEMTIEIGAFGGDDNYGYYQWVIYTPNDQVSVHRDIIIEKAAYESEEWGEENLLNYLKEDQPYNPYWDQFGVDEAQWNAEPDMAYIAFSIGKNAIGEWGPLARVDFTTPGLSGINEVATGKVRFSVNSDMVNACCKNPGVTVSIYDMTGRMVGKAITNADGNASISIANLSRGTYIVTDGSTSIKFMK